MLAPRTSRMRPKIRKFPKGRPRFRQKQKAGNLSKALLTKKFGPLAEVKPNTLTTLTSLSQRKQRLKRHEFELQLNVLRGKSTGTRALNRLWKTYLFLRKNGVKTN